MTGFADLRLAIAHLWVAVRLAISEALGLYLSMYGVHNWVDVGGGEVQNNES